MTYKQALCQAMRELAHDSRRVFLGYNVRAANGTMDDVPAAQTIEMPVAENLLVGAAIGMSLEGWKPVVWIERFDFILNAMDAIVNHLDKLAMLSDGEFRPAVLLRVCVGAKRRPLFSGPTHTQDFMWPMRQLVHFPVERMLTATSVLDHYRHAIQVPGSRLLIEYRDLYDEE